MVPKSTVAHAAAPTLQNGRESPVREERLRELGHEIRTRRTDAGLTVSGLAKRIGVSTSLISQVERGLTAPSLEVLWAVARTLDTPMGTFFVGNGPGQTAARMQAVQVVRANARKKISLPHAITFELLSPDLRHQIEFVWVDLQPHEEGPREPFVHAGEEQIVVIRGQVHIWIAGETHVLEEGDAITFDSSLPHRTMNVTDLPAAMISAGTPPSF